MCKKYWFRHLRQWRMQLCFHFCLALSIWLRLPNIESITRPISLCLVGTVRKFGWQSASIKTIASRFVLLLFFWAFLSHLKWTNQIPDLKPSIKAAGSFALCQLLDYATFLLKPLKLEYGTRSSDSQTEKASESVEIVETCAITTPLQWLASIVIVELISCSAIYFQYVKVCK